MIDRARLLSTGIVALALATFATAEEVEPRKLWNGYRPVAGTDVKELRLPFQDFLEDSVVRYETIGITKSPGEEFKIIDVEEFLDQFARGLESGADDILLFQIETCRKQELRYCPTLSYTNTGTAFFNNGRFVTCRHTFHNWISLASVSNGDRPVDTIAPPMRIFSSTGELLHNSAFLGEPLIKFYTINSKKSLNHVTFASDFPSAEIARPVAMADYVEFTFSEPMVPDFSLPERHFGTYNLAMNEETFAIGYPVKTSFFPDGIGDAPGRKEVISHGFAADRSDTYDLLQITNFLTPGASGGPVLTRSGEIVGVVCRSNTVENPDEIRTYAIPVGRDGALKFWLSIPYHQE